MTDFPVRGQQAPDYWDGQLQDYIDEHDAAIAVTANAASAAATTASTNAATALSTATDAAADLDTEEARAIAAEAALQAEIDALATGTVRGFFYPETYAAGDITYPNDATTAIQAAIDAAYTAGGGVVVLSDLYGFSGDIQHKNGVTVMGVGITGPQPSTTGLKAIAATARYRWGKFDGPGAHLYPGPIQNFCIDGDNVAGLATELLRCECVETSAYDIHVLQSLGNGVDLASSQNVNFFNCNFGSCTEGTAVVLRARSAGTQPPGHCVFYGGHLGDSKRTIWVTSHDASFFVGPHDNYFIGTIIETGRSAYDIDNVIQCDDGDTHLIQCVETIGAQVTAINNNCAILVQNDIRTATSTTLVLQNCSLGGGAGVVKATHAVRIKGALTHVSNQVFYFGRTAVANVTYMHCHDTADGIVQVDGPVVFITAVTGQFTTINGGTITGILRKTSTPTRWEAVTGTGSPIQVKIVGDAVNRVQVDGFGKFSWLDGVSGALRGTLQRLLAGGIHFMQMAGTWVPVGGWGRAVTTVTVNTVGQAVAIDCAAVSKVLLLFSGGTSTVGSITLTNIYDGCEIRIGISTPNTTNTITWPGTGAAGIVPRTTLPQPVQNVVQWLDLDGLSGKLYESGRSG